MDPVAGGDRPFSRTKLEGRSGSAMLQCQLTRYDEVDFQGAVLVRGIADPRCQQKKSGRYGCGMDDPGPSRQLASDQAFRQIRFNAFAAENLIPPCWRPIRVPPGTLFLKIITDSINRWRSI